MTSKQLLVAFTEDEIFYSDYAKIPIPGYAGCDADSEGNIWGITPGNGYACLRTSPDQDGYLRGNAYVDGNRVMFRVHRLVCLAFNGPKQGNQQALHFDDNKLNNKPWNLYWGTAKQNKADAIKNGRRGSENAKLSEEEVLEIRKRLAKGETPLNIAFHYKVSRRMICDIDLKNTWKNI